MTDFTGPWIAHELHGKKWVGHPGDPERGVPAVPDRQPPYEVWKLHDPKTRQRVHFESTTDWEGRPPFEAMARSMAESEERPIEWLWRGRFARGDFTIIDGDPEMGKSTIVLDFCARASHGGKLPDGASVSPCKCLLASTEDRPESRLQPMLRAAGANPNNIYFYDLPKDENGRERPLALPDDMDYLESEIEEAEADIVLMDPMMGFVSEGIRSGDDASIRRMLTPLAQMSAKYNCCLILIRHLKKDQREKDPMYRGGGSIGIAGQARIVLLVGKPPDTRELDPERVLAVTKLSVLDKRLIPSLKFEVESWDEDPDVPVVKWKGNCAVSARDLLRGTDARKNQPARDEAKYVIDEVLPTDGSPFEMNELYRQLSEAGVNKDTAKNAIRDRGYHKWPRRRSGGRIEGWFIHAYAAPCPDECPHRAARFTLGQGGNQGV